MTQMTVSSKGQVVLPAAIRKRLGLLTGMQLDVIEEADGVRLVVARPVKAIDIKACAGLVTAPTSGRTRRLTEFDPAVLLSNEKKSVGLKPTLRKKAGQSERG